MSELLLLSLFLWSLLLMLPLLLLLLMQAMLLCVNLTTAAGRAVNPSHVTTPPLLKYLHPFLCGLLPSLHYSEHLDYEVIQSTNPAFNRAVVRINVFKDHRQTIQYIQPHDRFALLF